MKKIVIAALLALVGYLFFWPVSIAPVAWDAPPAPELEGPYAVNDRLADVEALAKGIGRGPEDVVVDDDGYLYTGYEDGRVVRLTPDGRKDRLLADTGGRPLGMVFDTEGSLIVADGYRGLLRLDLDGNLEVLATEADGVPFRFTNNADVADDGTIYFSDASSQFGPAMQARDDILEHGGHGRLLAHDPQTGETRVLHDGLQFANGVAVAPDQRSVLVAETGRYTIVRHWLKGKRAGEQEIFYQNLPGLPDNLTSNGEDTFWVALYAPRNAALDALSQYPLLRKVAFRLPEFMQPQPAAHAFVLGLSLDGEVKYNLQHRSPDSYHPVTGVFEDDGQLYLGSLLHDAIGLVQLPDQHGSD